MVEKLGDGGMGMVCRAEDTKLGPGIAWESLLAMLGCMAGNLLTVCIIIAQQEEMKILDVLSRLNPEIALEFMKATFSPIDLLFYAFAINYGYKFSFRPLASEELASVVKS